MRLEEVWYVVNCGDDQREHMKLLILLTLYYWEGELQICSCLHTEDKQLTGTPNNNQFVWGKLVDFILRTLQL